MWSILLVTQSSIAPLLSLSFYHARATLIFDLVRDRSHHPNLFVFCPVSSLFMPRHPRQNCCYSCVRATPTSLSIGENIARLRSTLHSTPFSTVPSFPLPHASTTLSLSPPQPHHPDLAHCCSHLPRPCYRLLGYVFPQSHYRFFHGHTTPSSPIIICASPTLSSLLNHVMVPIAPVQSWPRCRPPMLCYHLATPCCLTQPYLHTRHLHPDLAFPD
jgi:hypothetical protein